MHHTGLRVESQKSSERVGATSAEREGLEPSVRLPLCCPNSQVLGFACAPAVFPKAVLARARKVVLKDWRRLARPRCARQGKTGAGTFDGHVVVRSMRADTPGVTMQEMRPSDALLAEALQLPDEERARLALRLAQSLDQSGGRDSEEAWAREVARRIERLRAGTAQTMSGEDALAQARARLSRRA